MNTTVLKPETKKVFDLLNTSSFPSNFYLSGGTGLALHLEHRESEDLDFFSRKSFSPEEMLRKLSFLGSPTQVELSDGTLNCYIDNVKVQFLHYPYPLLEQTEKLYSIPVSSFLDIACTKIITISMRGSKKDFIDLYFSLKSIPLSDLLHKVKEKYTKTQFSLPHILKSLTFFDDAEIQVMPKMRIPTEWENIKSTLVSEVKKLNLKILA